MLNYRFKIRALKRKYTFLVGNAAKGLGYHRLFMNRKGM